MSFLLLKYAIDLDKLQPDEIQKIGQTTIHKVQIEQFCCLPKLFKHRNKIKGSNLGKIPKGV